MYQLKHDKAEIILRLANAEQINNAYKLKNFVFSFEKSAGYECVTMRGIIPYLLAKKFYDEFRKNILLIEVAYEQMADGLIDDKFDSQHFTVGIVNSARKQVKSKPIEECYLTFIELRCAAELKFVINMLMGN